MPVTASTARSKSESTKSGRFTRTAHFLFTQILPPAATAAAMEGAAACVEAAGGRILFGDLNDPKSDVCKALASNYSIRRKPNLGTQPGVYYLI